MKKNQYVAIMAGGVGARFWPSSTTDHPKQFLDILGVGKSLLRLTYERFLKDFDKDNILVVTNDRYVDLVKKHIPELASQNILAEPSRNNTGPCIALTALKLFKINEDAIFVVAPSDHFIVNEALFLDKIKASVEYVSNHNAIITLGIAPTRPDTGYGYIEVQKKEDGFIKVIQFREKPDLKTAESYLAAGNYFWNAGIFVWKAKDLLNAFEQHSPEILTTLKKDVSKINTEEEKEYLKEVYPLTTKISVDYAILEKANNVYTLPADIGWSDLGTWNSLHAFMQEKKEETVSTGQNIILIDTSNSIIRSDNAKTVLIKGLKDYIVVDEGNALLIYPKSDETEIKEEIKKLNS